MKVYSYSYKLDSTNESIGKVRAENVEDAKVLITKIKNLNIDSIETIFNITEIEKNE